MSTMLVVDMPFLFRHERLVPCVLVVPLMSCCRDKVLTSSEYRDTVLDRTGPKVCKVANNLRLHRYLIHVRT